MKLVTPEDWRLFILANAPVRGVKISAAPDDFAVTITVRFKRWVLRRERALRCLTALLEDERPVGMKLTVRAHR